MGIKKLCRYIKPLKLPIIITIIGRMNSGKTFLGKKLHEYCFSSFNYIEGDLNTIEGLQNIRNDSYIFFDDFSFLLTGRGKESQELLNKLFRVRHFLQTDNVVLAFSIHYAKSIAPFIRYGQVRILTSLTPPEVNALANEYLFTPTTLWDYLYYVQKYPKRYIVLFTNGFDEKIVDVTE